MFTVGAFNPVDPHGGLLICEATKASGVQGPYCNKLRKKRTNHKKDGKKE